jgi:hypothetical protein
MKIRITGKGQNKALIDPLTGHKVFIHDNHNKSHDGSNTGLMEAII